MITVLWPGPNRAFHLQVRVKAKQMHDTLRAKDITDTGNETASHKASRMGNV
jgi:hypothetical protein